MTVAAAAGAIALSGCGSDGSSDDGDAPAHDGPSADPCAGQAPGTACTWLGIKGDEGFNGDGHLRYQTRLNQVQDLAFLADGTAWFTDFNNYLVRKVKTDGTVVSVVGWTDPVFPGDGPPGGPTPEGATGDLWQLNHPTNLLAMPDGTVLLAAWHNHKLLQIDPASDVVKVVCGSGSGFAGDGGPASKALFKQPNDVTMDDDGNIYVEDQQNWRVRKIDTDDNISTIAGVGQFGSMGDGGPADMAQFAWAFGSNPNPSGGIVWHDGKIYVADTEANRVRVIDLAGGTVDALAGTGDAGFAGDGGPARAAKLRAPRDLEMGPEGDLYIADTDNGAVRAVDLKTGVIRTVVGTGELGMDDEEQLPATQFHLRRPFGIAFDHDGNLYVMDTLNDRIVKVAK